jgi:hypothetical protein
MYVGAVGHCRVGKANRLKANESFCTYISTKYSLSSAADNAAHPAVLAQRIKSLHPSMLACRIA